MATIRTYPGKRGVRYSAQIRVLGRSETKSFSTRTAAKEWARKRELELKEQPHLAGAPKHTLGEAIERYVRDYLPERSTSMQRNQGTQLAWWKDRLGHLPLAHVQAPVLVEARDELKRRPLSPAAVNRYLSAIGIVLSTAYREWHWTQSNPLEGVSRLREPQGRTRYLDDQTGPDGTSELSRLIEACRISESPMLLEAVLLTLTTGGRRNEVMSLRWGDLDFSTMTVTLSGEKTGHRRTVSLSPDVAGLLAPRRALPRALVFPSPNDPGRPVDLKSAWTTALKRAGIRDFRFHDLRHSAAAYAAMSGASLAELAAMLGHRSLAMVARYIHMSAEHVARASTRIGERVSRAVGDVTSG